MKLDGSDQKQITDFGSMSWAPYEHPSGEYFIFASNKLGFENFEVFMVDAAGTKEPVRVTYSDGFDGLPVPSPDGRSSRGPPAAPAAAPGSCSSRSGTIEKALEALRNAPPRESRAESHDTAARLASHRPARPRPAPRAAPQAQPRPRRRTKAHVDRARVRPLDGRLAGIAGENAAPLTTSSPQLQRIGAQPLPGTIRLPRAVRVHRRHEGRRIDVAVECAGGAAAARRRFDQREGRPRAVVLGQWRQSAAPLVFAGYGIVVPDSQDFGYDSYATLDVKDKIVLVLRYFPEDADPKTKAILARYSDLRYKAMAARQRGAKACSSSPARAHRTPAKRFR